MKQKNPKAFVTMPKELKEAVEHSASKMHCSQAEIVRAALYQYLRK